jgi:hypothetical protein
MFKLIRGLAGEVHPATPGASKIGIARAVFWSFFGVRKMRNLEADAQSITPLQVIGAGLAGALVFVLALVTIARLVAG